MITWQDEIQIATRGQGFVEITSDVRAVADRSGVTTGLAHVFCLHTSCSLAIQENADPSARHDMEAWLTRIAPEDDPHYTHTHEGPDDMPAHLRSLVTRTSETIPVRDGGLVMGTWQGLYLCEHRRAPHRRRLVVTVSGT